MSYNISFTPDANSDFSESTSWYKEQKSGLDNRFYLAVVGSIGLIAENPFLYAVRHKGIRAAPIKNFPFSIYYVVEEIWQLVVVIAVLHHARNPMIWKDRA